MLDLVMLLKLAFVMQRLTKHLKNFCHDQQRWILSGGHSCYEGEHRVHENRDSWSFSL